MHRFLGRRMFGLVRAACAAFALTAAAHAQTCTVGMTAVAFGNVNVLPGAAVDTTATLTVTCSGGTGNAGQRVCISIGAGSAGDATSRIMNGPSSSTARYDLYSDSARTTKWGSWQTGYDLAGVQLDVAKNSTANVTVYARFLAAQPTDTPGSYSSTFTSNPFIQYANKAAAVCPTGALTAVASTSASATVTSSCNVSATSVAFGTTTLLTSNKDAQGTLSIQCSLNLPYTVSLNGGNAGATDPTQRKMAFSGANVTYGLYKDTARSQPWGDSAGVNTNSGTGTGTSQSFTVYGRIAAQTTPKPGTYSDTIIATVSY